MPSKNTKTKACEPDRKPESEEEKVYAGGNPGFDERKPTGSDRTSGTVHAGVNPHFDERQPGRTKAGSD